MFHKSFPYTNFHDLNLDWLLARLREYIDITHALDENIREFEGRVEIDIEEFKTYVNDRIDGFVEYVENYLEDLAVPEAVQEILDRWLEDGVFDEVLERLVTDAMEEWEEKWEKKLSSNDIDIENLYTYVFKDGRGTGDGGTYYPVFQALCVLDNGNFVTVANDENNTTNNVKLREYSGTTGGLIRENVVQAGHANGCAYANGKIYIVWMRDNVSNESVGKITVVDSASLSTLETKDLGFPIRAIAYDDDKNEFIVCGGETFYVYDSTISTQIESFNIRADYSADQGLQDICYYNNMVGVIVSYPNLIDFYDLEAHERVKCYSPEEKISANGLPFNEIESVDFHEGKFYICSFSRLDNRTSYSNIAFMDPWHNTIMDYTKKNRFSGVKTVYVDGSYTGVVQNGDMDTPFSHIMLALSAVQSKIHSSTPITISCRRRTKVGGLICHDIANLAVTAYRRTEDPETTDPYTIEGLRLNRCSNFHIEGANFEYAPGNSTGNASAYVINSTGHFVECGANTNITAPDNAIALFVGARSHIDVVSFSCINAYTEGIRVTDQAEVIATGTMSMSAPTRVRTFNQARYYSTVKMKPADVRYRFDSQGIVGKPWIHAYSGTFNNIGSANLNNDAYITNLNQGVSEICIEVGMGDYRRKHVINLTTDNGTSAFNLDITAVFGANVWNGACVGTIDLANKSMTIIDQISTKVVDGSQYIRSQYSGSGIAWCGILNVWVR